MIASKYAVSNKKPFWLILTGVLVTLGASFINNTPLSRGAFFTDCTDTATTGITQVQCEALEDLYNATNGDLWTTNANWGTNSNVDTWEGVVRSGTDVQILDLSTNNLTGEIPSSIEDLINLKRLYLQHNNLSGTIPSTVGNLSSLTHLYLHHNDLGGVIPNSIGLIAPLTHLYLNNNTFSATIPLALTNLSNLIEFDLSNNQLLGTIPVTVGGMTNLVILNLGNNKLTGTIPTTFGALTALKQCYLYANLLTGSIPVEIGNMTALEKLSLHSNSLSGTIPTQLGNLVNLRLLSIGNNELTGNIPASLATYPALEKFYLYNNELSGTIPDFTVIPTLTQLAFYNNKFVFEDFEAQHTAYKNYAVYFNGGQRLVDTEQTLSKSIGDALSIVASVAINPSGNDHFQWYKDLTLMPGETGNTLTIPSLSATDSGGYLYTISNDVIDDFILVSNTFTVNFNDYCDDTVTMGVPTDECLALLDFYATLDGVNWTTRTNWGTAVAISTWYGVTVSGGHVTGLDLSSNQLSGVIPVGISGLTSLTNLDLSQNNLTGAIPTELTALGSLSVLDLHQNQLSGAIPPSFENQTTLTDLDLSHNNLSGSIYSGLGGLVNLTNLDFNHNNLTGVLPSTFSALVNLTNLDVSSNQLSGTVPSIFGLLVNLTDLNLSHNQFESTLPASIGSLASLINLDLSTNTFSGSVPSGIATLPNLQTVKLANNTFGGAFPDLTAIAGMNSLTIENNNFVFEDFEAEYPTYTTYGTFTFIPQKLVDIDRLEVFDIGNPFTLTPQIGLNPSGNDEYQWYKNGIVIPSGNTRIYTQISTINDQGIYTYRVTNPNVPGLTLQSRDITLFPKNNGFEVDCMNTVVTGIPESECEALEAFYFTLNGPNWTDNTNWGSITNLTLWKGITIENGHVTGLTLPNNNLQGNFPAVIGNLPELSVLDLSDNSLFGIIPTSIKHLTLLEILNLSGNDLSGEIPIEIGDLVALKYLYLNHNNLSGTIPDEVGNLVGLERLYLNDNKLSCAIPNTFTSLTNLTFHIGLQVARNNLQVPVVGSVLDLFLNDKSPVGVEHFSNQNVPACNLPQLPPIDIVLDDDHVNEAVPVGSLVGNLSAVDPDSAVFTFTLVSGFGDTDNSEFQIVGSQLRSNAVFDYETKTHYDIRINVSDGLNSYAENFTIQIDDVQDDEFLNCSTQTYFLEDECQALVDFYNALDGDSSNLNWKTESDPSKWNHLVNEEVDGKIHVRELSAEGLSGEIPSSLVHLSNLRALRLDNNNNIHGGIPNFFGLMSELEHLLLGNNNFSGSIPDTIGLSPSLRTLSLSSNNLTGSIPPSIGALANLEYLYLSDNELSCEIPLSIKNLNNLVEHDGLRLQNNHLLTPEVDTPFYDFLETKSPSGSASFTVQPGKFCQNIPYDILLSAVDIDENEPPNTFIGNLTTLDEDIVGPYTYSLVSGEGDSDNASFKIIGTTLVSNDVFDYEAKSTYMIRINTNDGFNDFEKAFAIQINDLNTPPTDIFLSNNLLIEGQRIGTLIGTFTMQDDQEHTAEIYSLVSGIGDTGNASFSIVGNQLKTNAVYDFTTNPFYSIRVKVDDGSGSFEKIFIITIESDQDGDQIKDTVDPNPTDACIPNNLSLACLILDRDSDGVSDGADTDPNDACVPSPKSAACKSKWGPLWEGLYGDDPVPETPLPSPQPTQITTCGQSCRYSIKRYEGGYFTGATGKDGVFRIGDWITYHAPSGHPLENYRINYSNLGIFGMQKPGQSFQIRQGYIDRKSVVFPIEVSNSQGKRIVLLNSPKIIIDNMPTVYTDKGFITGASGRDGAFLPGDWLRYHGPVDRKVGDRFEVDLHWLGATDFVPENRAFIIPQNIKNFIGKPLDIYATATDTAGNTTNFLVDTIWIGKVGKIIEVPLKPSASKQTELKKVPQWKKSPFRRPVLKDHEVQTLSERIAQQKLIKK